MNTSSQWADTNFAAAQLGNQSRTKRLVRIATDLAGKAGASLPAVCAGDDAKLAGLYRFMNNDRIQPAMITAVHIEETLAQCRRHARILCVQDTTELDFSGREVDGLGEIGNGRNQGLLQHSALALSETGQLLGVLDINTHVRIKAPAGETRSRRHARRTQLHMWTDAADRNSRRDFGTTRILNICDRGGDCAGCLFGFHELNQGFVIRARYDRKATGDETRLWAHLGNQAAQLEYDLAVPVRLRRKSCRHRPGKVPGVRTAKLQVRYSAVTIPPPINDRRYAHYQPLQLWAVQVREQDAPDQYEAVEWMLLSSEEVRTATQAQEVINHYKHRWQIEEWHRCLKQGCALEQIQLKSVAAIQKAAAICSVVAVRLLQLKQLSRDAGLSPVPALTVMPAAMVAVAAAQAGKSTERLSVKEFYEQVAKTGGWLRRSGEPGWLTLWRGWRELDMMCVGYLIAAKHGEKNV